MPLNSNSWSEINVVTEYFKVNLLYALAFLTNDKGDILYEFDVYQ